MLPESSKLAIRSFVITTFVVALLLLFSRLAGHDPFGNDRAGIAGTSQAAGPQRAGMGTGGAPSLESLVANAQFRRPELIISDVPYRALVLPDLAPRRPHMHLRFLPGPSPRVPCAHLRMGQIRGELRLPGRAPRDFTVLARSPALWTVSEKGLFVKAMEQTLR